MFNTSSIDTIVKFSNFLLIICFSLGCFKDKPEHHPFSADALAYFKMERGKYFIYKDSLSGKLDSVVVTESLLERYDGTFLDKPYTAERYSLTLSKVESNITTEWLSAKANSWIWSSQLYDKNGPAIFSGVGCNCGHPSILINAITVEGKTYTDVNLTNSHYWAKGVGLIKVKRSNSNIYVLVRSN